MTIHTSPSNAEFQQDQEPLIMTMNLKWFNGSKGFGFVVPEDESFDAFLHITMLQESGTHMIGEGAVLECEIEDGPKGKQVKRIVKILDHGSLNTFPEVNEEDGTITMGGLVKWYKPEKGFGFIIPDDGIKDIFVHKTCVVSSELEELRDGDRVRVTFKSIDKGREAVKIEVLD